MDVEVIEPTAIEALASAEVNQSIATAKRYPRDVKDCIKRATGLVTLSPEIAEECHFSVPRGGKDIEGPSVRLAEILVHAWGNLRAGARVLDIGERDVTVQGMCHDLESNSSIQKEVRRRIVDKHGRRYKDDMILTTCNAAASIAFRNAVFACVPKALWVDVENAALKAANSAPLPERRNRAIAWFEARNVELDDILRVLEVDKVSDINAEHLTKLNGFRNAIREGAVKVEEIFGGDTDELPNATELVDALDNKK